MSNSDSGWQRPKRRKTKEERLMAALKAVMRDGSSSRRSSRRRSRNRNRSRNNTHKGSKGPHSRSRDQTPVAKKEKKTKPYMRPPVLRATPTNNEWQCANCAQTNWMTRKECCQCHKMPPGPSSPMPLKEVASGSTGHPHAAWAGCRQGQVGTWVRQDCLPGRQGPACSRSHRQERGHEHSGHSGGTIRENHRLSGGMQPQGQPASPNDGVQITLPPETRAGVRVDQATARLTRAQKLKAELEEKLLEVERAVQDNLTEIAAATAELENAKRALIPSAPSTDLGSACITFSREQSADTPRVFALMSEKHGHRSRRKGKSKTALQR